MSLDFVLANSEDEAVRLYPDVSLDDDEHDSLASEWAADTKPLLHRISDYYEDAVYQDDDISGLITELKASDKKLPAIVKLKKLCKEAQLKNKTIYVFAD